MDRNYKAKLFIRNTIMNDSGIKNTVSRIIDYSLPFSYSISREDKKKEILSAIEEIIDREIEDIEKEIDDCDIDEYWKESVK